MEAKMALSSSEIEESLQAITKFMQKFNRVMNKSNNIHLQSLPTENDQPYHTIKKTQTNSYQHKIKNKLSTVLEQSLSQKATLSPLPKPSQQSLDHSQLKLDHINNHHQHQPNYHQHILKYNTDFTAHKNQLETHLERNDSYKKKSQSMKRILGLKDSIKQETIREENQKITISHFDKDEHQLNKNCKNTSRKIVKIKNKNKCKENQHPQLSIKTSKKQHHQPIQSTKNMKISIKQCISRKKVNLFQVLSNRKKGLSLTKSIKTQKSKQKPSQYSKDKKTSLLSSTISQKFYFKAPTNQNTSKPQKYINNLSQFYKSNSTEKHKNRISQTICRVVTNH